MNAIVARMEERITDTSLIVENRNTCDDNSPTVPLTEKQIAELRACAAKQVLMCPGVRSFFLRRSVLYSVTNEV